MSTNSSGASEAGLVRKAGPRREREGFWRVGLLEKRLGRPNSCPAGLRGPAYKVPWRQLGALRDEIRVLDRAWALGSTFHTFSSSYALSASQFLLVENPAPTLVPDHLPGWARHPNPTLLGVGGCQEQCGQEE